MERAIETERVMLLRLLAGWTLLVEALSCAGWVPRWLLVFLTSLMRRAETATAYLVIVSARSLATRNASESRSVFGAVSYVLDVIEREEEFSADALLARIRTLKAKLEDLPRHALRLLRRCAVPKGREGSFTGYGLRRPRPGLPVLLHCQRLAPGTTYPPIG